MITKIMITLLLLPCCCFFKAFKTCYLLSSSSPPMCTVLPGRRGVTGCVRVPLHPIPPHPTDVLFFSPGFLPFPSAPARHGSRPTPTAHAHPSSRAPALGTWRYLFAALLGVNYPFTWSLRVPWCLSPFGQIWVLFIPTADKS